MDVSQESRLEVGSIYFVANRFNYYQILKKNIPPWEINLERKCLPGHEWINLLSKAVFAKAFGFETVWVHNYYISI